MIIVPKKRDKTVNSYLEEVRVLTALINENKKNTTDLQARRTARVISLRENEVTYSEIAKAMGTTYQNVSKTIKDARNKKVSKKKVKEKR